MPWKSMSDTASAFKRFLGRWPAPVVALSLWFLHGTAHAEVWAYIDAQGTAHFAATQVDERYALYLKGNDVAALTLQTELAPPGAASLGLKPDGQGGEPRFVLPKRFAKLDSSRGYQAVQAHLRAAAKTHKVDYELLKAVVAAESGFDAEAVSPKGAVGLMQLLPTTAQQFGVVADAAGRRDRKGKPLPARSIEEKLTDPQTNINAGARYLAYLIKLFKGEVDLAVAAYNAGEGAVQRAGNRIPNYKETQGYVKTVMGLYGLFKPGNALAADGRASAAAASPLARAVGRVAPGGAGRVRVALPGPANKGDAVAASASTGASAGAGSSAMAGAGAGALGLTAATVRGAVGAATDNPRLAADVRVSADGSVAQ